MKYFHYKQSFTLESGAVLPELTIAYHTYGTLNERGDNVIWICHALTANSDVEAWWPNIIGEDEVFDPAKYFIVCANILGSCYGTTGPLSTNPQTGQPYYSTFPFITIRDMVSAHQLLCTHLNIHRIQLLVGGSMGGYQALEWCYMEPEKVEQLFLLTTVARETAWGIAIHTAQRLAIEADSTWNNNTKEAGQKGLKTARAIGMITYRNYHTFKATQTDTSLNKVDKFKASSYIEHQGSKLVNRFNAYSYWLLTKAMDSHNIARDRGARVEDVLSGMRQKTLVIAIKGDILCPPEEQQFIVEHMPNALYVEIESLYGHDGFLVEREEIQYHLSGWFKTQKASLYGKS